MNDKQTCDRCERTTLEIVKHNHPGAVVVEVEAGHPADAFDAIFSDDELLDKGGTLIFVPDKEQSDE